jgi:carbon-monoxide dehydrogenase iron sulfur subunit
MSRVITVEVEKCLACKTCEVQCAVAHSVARELLEASQESPRPQPRVAVMGVSGMAIPLQCRQCEDAPCVAVCPAGGLRKPEGGGPVSTNSEVCIGCKQCMLVCPFGVITLGSEGHAIIKCDLCLERLEQGEQPACVAGCPTHALKLTEVEEVTAERRRAAATEIATALDRNRATLKAAMRFLDTES